VCEELLRLPYQDRVRFMVNENMVVNVPELARLFARDVIDDKTQDEHVSSGGFDVTTAACEVKLPSTWTPLAHWLTWLDA
tara:strand:+ start:237 stop:476 length:240 start_codon:yes stop_codon:yes gene_type:complete